MASLNIVRIIGNLGHDPELRHTRADVPVANLSVATNDVFTDKSGERRERTEWHRVVVWGPQAQACANFLEKGRQILVEGSIRTREWTDGSGAKMYTTEINARRVTFLDGPRRT